MMMLSWIRKLFTRPVTRTFRKAPRWARLAVEELESRWCPSTFTVTSSLDDGSVGSLRWAVDQVNSSPSATGDTIQLVDTLTGGQTITLLSTLNIYSSSGTLTISAAGATAVTIDGHNSVQDISSSRDLVLDNLTIANGLATNGAGIYDTGNVTAQSCTFDSNSASWGGMLDGTAKGGAIYSGANVTATDCTFQSNSASASPSVFGNGFGYGGAIYSGGNVMASNCTFDTNSASGSGLGYASGIGLGGAVYSGAKVMASNCTFDTNSASGSSGDGDGDGYGGAIYSYSVGVTATGCTFDANYAKGVTTNTQGSGSAHGEGGAIDSYADVTATNCTFDANYADGEITNPQVVSGTFSFSAYGEGGAIYSSADGTATNCTFDGNYASAQFYYFVGYTVTRPPSISIGYYVQASGGAIYSNGPVTVTNCTFDANHTEGDSYYFNYYYSGTNNGTSGAGGAVYASSGTIVNCIFANNFGRTSEDGGATFSSSASGAVFGLVATPLALDYCLFFANGSDNVSDYVGATADPNCLFGKDPVLGSLQDNGGPTWTMALGTGSAALNAGTTSGAALVDQRGYVRDSQPDIGAYEFFAGTPVSPVITVTSGSIPQSAAVGTEFANPLRVSVATPGSTPIPNYTVILQAPTSGASGTFSSDGLSAVTLITDSNGTAGDTFTANTIVGPYTVSGDGGTSFSLTNTADVPYSVTVSGGNQSAPVGTNFGSQLTATVTDQYGNVVSGASVTFTAPASGASGTFTNTTNSITATTGSNGQVSVVLTAETQTGTYSVGVAVAGGLHAINDTIDGLTNTVALLAQTITFNPLADVTYGDADFAISATATSGLPVSFTASGNAGVYQDIGSGVWYVHITGAGSATITAHQAGNAGYDPAPDVSQGLSIALALSALPDWTVHKSYTPVVTATGGTGPYSFSVASDALPKGLTLNADGSFKGSPTATGQFTFTLQASQGASVSGTRSYTVTIHAAPTIGNPTVRQWTKGQSGFTGTMTIANGTPMYAILGQPIGLPAGLTAVLSGNTISFTGTPSTTGTFHGKITIEDLAGAQITKKFTIKINPAPTFKPAALAPYKPGKLYFQKITTAGGTATRTVSYTLSVPLPAGLTISPLSPTTGAITIRGKTSATTSVTIIMTVTDATGAQTTITYMLVPRQVT